jgi:hypothetical protein
MKVMPGSLEGTAIKASLGGTERTPRARLRLEGITQSFAGQPLIER